MDRDRIEKKVLLRASRERVWRAISDSREFGTWFGAEIDAPFVAGETLVGRMVPTKIDPEVARMQEACASTRFVLMIERVEPMQLLAFRWHPGAVDIDGDYESEPTTLVTFELADAEGGVLLTITESGFAQLPPERRRAAFDANEGGWEHQSRLIAKYLEMYP
jgi:uncharacterized protein YndB with AHSA1/START domain